jgi:hypothetical protein
MLVAGEQRRATIYKASLLRGSVPFAACLLRSACRLLVGFPRLGPSLYCLVIALSRFELVDDFEGRFQGEFFAFHSGAGPLLRRLRAPSNRVTCSLDQLPGCLVGVCSV